MIDVQASTVAARFRIEAVGVTSLAHPIQALDAPSGAVQRTAAQWTFGVSLAADQRGTHMSRFVEELNALGDAPLGPDEMLALAHRLATTLGADKDGVTTVSARFAWFRRVAAPVSGKTALLEGQATYAARTGPDATKTVTVSVPAKALCPCSKAISDRGAHNQRSDITVSLDLAPDAPAPSLDKLMAMAETSASSPVYPLLKREDEKFVTECAFDNPAFVEDIVRAAAGKLLDVPGVRRFTVEAINRESIHAHDCFARIVHETGR